MARNNNLFSHDNLTSDKDNGETDRLPSQGVTIVGKTLGQTQTASFHNNPPAQRSDPSRPSACRSDPKRRDFYARSSPPDAVVCSGLSRVRSDHHPIEARVREIFEVEVAAVPEVPFLKEVTLRFVDREGEVARVADDDSRVIEVATPEIGKTSDAKTIAFVIAHELGHIIARTDGLPIVGSMPNESLADLLGLIIAQRAGFDMREVGSIAQFVRTYNETRGGMIEQISRDLREPTRPARVAVLSLSIPGIHVLPSRSATFRLLDPMLESGLSLPPERIPPLDATSETPSPINTTSSMGGPVTFDAAAGKLCQGEILLPSDLSDPFLTGLINVKGDEEDGREVHLTKLDLVRYLDPALPPEELQSRRQRLADLQSALKATGCRLPTPFLSETAKTWLESRAVPPGSTRSCASLPPQAEEIGFRLISVREFTKAAGSSLNAGAQHLANVPVLVIPSIGTSAFFPSLTAETLTEDDCFTRMDYNPTTKTLSFATSEGERGTIVVEPDKGYVNLEFVDPDNRSKIFTETYEPDLATAIVLKELLDSESIAKGPTLVYKPDAQTLSALGGEGSQELWSLPFKVPERLKVDIVEGGIIRIADRHGVPLVVTKFQEAAISGILGRPLRFAADLLYPKYVEGSPKPVGFHRTNASGGEVFIPLKRLQGYLDEVEAIVSGEEARRAGEKDITVAGHKLKAYGPTREGFYEIVSTSGRSSLFIDPRSDRVVLGRGWHGDGGDNTIVSVDLSAGRLVVTETIPGKPGQIYTHIITIHYDNTGARRGYSVESRHEADAPTPATTPQAGAVPQGPAGVDARGASDLSLVETDSPFKTLNAALQVLALDGKPIGITPDTLVASIKGVTRNRIRGPFEQEVILPIFARYVDATLGLIDGDRGLRKDPQVQRLRVTLGMAKNLLALSEGREAGEYRDSDAIARQEAKARAYLKPRLKQLGDAAVQLGIDYFVHARSFYAEDAKLAPYFRAFQVMAYATFKDSPGVMKLIRKMDEKGIVRGDYQRLVDYSKGAGRPNYQTLAELAADLRAKKTPTLKPLEVGRDEGSKVSPDLTRTQGIVFVPKVVNVVNAELQRRVNVLRQTPSLTTVADIYESFDREKILSYGGPDAKLNWTLASMAREGAGLPPRHQALLDAEALAGLTDQNEATLLYRELPMMMRGASPSYTYNGIYILALPQTYEALAGYVDSELELFAKFSDKRLDDSSYREGIEALKGWRKVALAMASAVRQATETNRWVRLDDEQGKFLFGEITGGRLGDKKPVIGEIGWDTGTYVYAATGYAELARATLGNGDEVYVPYRPVYEIRSTDVIATPEWQSQLDGNNGMPSIQPARSYPQF